MGCICSRLRKTRPEPPPPHAVADRMALKPADITSTTANSNSGCRLSLSKKAKFMPPSWLPPTPWVGRSQSRGSRIRKALMRRNPKKNKTGPLSSAETKSCLQEDSAPEIESDVGPVRAGLMMSSRRMAATDVGKLELEAQSPLLCSTVEVDLSMLAGTDLKLEMLDSGGARFRSGSQVGSGSQSPRYRGQTLPSPRREQPVEAARATHTSATAPVPAAASVAVGQDAHHRPPVMTAMAGAPRHGYGPSRPPNPVGGSTTDLAAAATPVLITDAATVPVSSNAAANTQKGACMGRFDHATFMHEGGQGGRAKSQQDAFFVKQSGSGVLLCGVFDGHGRRNGRKASQVAASAVRAHLMGNVIRMLASPDAVGKVIAEAFDKAHDTFREELLEAGGSSIRQYQPPDGSPAYLLEWLPCDEDQPSGRHDWDASDGGTTASVAVLLPSCAATGAGRLVIGSVGDSSSVLLHSRLPSQGSRAVSSQRLLPDHTPINGAEFIRMRQASSRTPLSP